MSFSLTFGSSCFLRSQNPKFCAANFPWIRRTTGVVTTEPAPVQVPVELPTSGDTFLDSELPGILPGNDFRFRMDLLRQRGLVLRADSAIDRETIFNWARSQRVIPRFPR